MSHHAPSEALFVVTSMVDDWAGQGPAVIQWAATQRSAQQLPWPPSVVVEEFTELAPDVRSTVVQAIERFFTEAEAHAVGRLLTRDYPIWSSPVRYGKVSLPLTAAEVLAMQTPNQAASSQTLWRVRSPAGGLPGLSLAIEGIVSLWPWPGLAPEDIVPLMTMRERLGLDPVPPLSSPDDAARPGTPGVDDD